MLIAIWASALALAAWVYLLAGHGGYWRTDQRLPAATGDSSVAGATSQAASPARWPSVVAVIPARNESAVLPGTLPTLLAQDYPGEFAVLLVDDESTDGTGQVAAGLGEQPPSVGGTYRPPSLRVVHGEPVPAGWAGKVWAMAQGARAAGDADYLLFTDADIAYAPGTLTALVRAARADDRVLVSQMALLRADAFWERLLVPAFVYFFAMLYPFRRVNRRGGRTAAAAGGCMLVHSDVLAEAGGLDRIRGARIDDVALGQLLKRPPVAGGCWLGFSTQVTSRRPYAKLADVWDMVARSAYTQLRYSPAALAGTVAGLAWLYLLPVAAAVGGLALLVVGTGSARQQAAWLAATGVAAWAAMSLTYLPMLRLYRLSAFRAPGLPLIALLYSAMTISSAGRHHAGRGGEWKGRVIPAGQQAD